MSQQDFAEAYRIPIGTLRDWEQGRSEPDQAGLVLLQLIDADAKGVLKALKKVPATAPSCPGSARGRQTC